MSSPDGAPEAQPSLFFVVTEDWYFWSHRLDLARAAQAAGYAVILATRFTAHRARIEAEGIRCLPLPITRGLGAPWRDARVMLELARLWWHQPPTVVHAVALKPMLLCALGAYMARGTAFCLAATGLGHLFTAQKLSIRPVRLVVSRILACLVRLPRSVLIVQNRDDLATLIASGVDVRDRGLLIRGSGVDLARFQPTPLPSSGVPLVLMPARVLIDKGVREFAAAAARLRAAGTACRCVLVGGLDPGNPSALSRAAIESLCAETSLEWWDHREDMPQAYAAATLVCLPSYREGLPKALLEAAACGRPLVATDVPGCREICLEGVTGGLVPARDDAALAARIAAMLANRAGLERMALAARNLVTTEFSVAAINEQTLAAYARLRGADAP